MAYYPSEEKYTRAKEAVKNYAKFAAERPGLAEVRLVAKGLEEGLKDEKLVEFVYEGLGGKQKIEGAAAKEAEAKAKEARTRGEKNRTGEMKRNEIKVK